MRPIDSQPDSSPIDFTQLKLKTTHGEKKVEDLIEEIRNRKGENGLFRRFTSWIRSTFLKQGVSDLLKSVSNKELNIIYELANKNFDGQLKDFFKVSNFKESSSLLFLQKVEREIEQREKVLAIWEYSFPIKESESLAAEKQPPQKIEIAAIAEAPVSIGNRLNIALGTLQPINPSTITSILSKLISSQAEDYQLISELTATYGANVLDYEFLKQIVEQVPNNSDRKKAAQALAGYAIKCFGHEFGIGGNIRAGKHELAAEGWQQHITHMKLESSFTDFIRTSSSARQIDSEIAHTITQSIQRGVRLSEGVYNDQDIELALQAYRRKEPVIIPTGWLGHATEIVLFDGLLAYANRGQATDEWSSGIAFYSIQKPENINREFIRTLVGADSTEATSESELKEEALTSLAKKKLPDTEREDPQKIAQVRKKLKVSKEETDKEISEIKETRIIAPLMRFYETPSEPNGMHERLGLVPFFRFDPSIDLKKVKNTLVLKKIAPIVYQKEAQAEAAYPDDPRAIAMLREEINKEVPFLIAEQEKKLTDAEVLAEIAKKKDTNKLAKPDQKVGNCAWASAKCGLEALLYLTKMKAAIENYNATKQADAPTLGFPPVLPGADPYHQSQEYFSAYTQVMQEADVFRSTVYSAWAASHRIAELDNVLNFIQELDSTYHLFTASEKYKFIAQLFFKFANATKLSKYSLEDPEIVNKLQNVADQIYRHAEFTLEDTLQDISVLSAKDCNEILRQLFNPSSQGDPRGVQFSEGTFAIMKVNSFVKIDNVIQKDEKGKPLEESKVKLFYVMGGKRHELELEMEGSKFYVKPFGNDIRLPFHTNQDLSDFLKTIHSGFKGLSLPIHNQKAIEKKLSRQKGLD